MAITIGRPEPGEQAEPTGLSDNPAGYTRPGGGYDPDGDGVLNPMRAARIAEQHQRREAAGSGSFSLDPEAMRALLPRWEDVRDRLGKLMDQGDRLKLVTKPADDEASNKQIQAAGNHQEIYAAIIKQQYKYADEYVKRLKTAIDKFERSDQAAGEAVQSVEKDM